MEDPSNFHSNIPYFSWRHERSLRFCDRGYRFFPRVGVIMILKRFDVLFESKLSVVRLYHFCYCCVVFFVLLVFCLRAKMTNTSSSSLRSFHIILKEKSRKRSKYLSDKVQSKGDIRNGETFRIFSFSGFGCGGQSDRKWNGRQECKVLYEEEGTV